MSNADDKGQSADVDHADANQHGFVGYPTGQVYGIIEDPTARVLQIMGDLLALDVATDAIHVYCCQEGAEELSPSGQGYGVKARVQRVMQLFGVEREIMGRVERALTDGGAVVGVAVDSPEAKAAVAELLHRNGAHEVHHFGRFVVEDL